MEAYQTPEINELATALAAAQAVLGPAVKDATNPMLRNKYATLNACVEACRKVLPQYGLSVTQLFFPSDDNHVIVRTQLMHTSGQWIASTMNIKTTGNRGINDAQAAGSASTYARRYGLCAIVGLVADDDDDACTAGPTREQQQQQRAQQPQQRQQSKPAEHDLRPALFSLLRSRGFEDPDEMKAELSNFFGRQVTATNELSQAEIQEYMDACAADKEDGDHAE